MLRAVGIDLGSTHSVIAALRAGEPQPLANRANSPLTPSVLAVDRAGGLLVGHAAKAPAVDPESVVYPFGPAAEDGAPLNGRHYTPHELTSLLLAALKEDAEARLGEPVRRAVLTAPACFDGHQIAALRLAAAMAGLLPLRIIPSPVAAALAYALSRPQPPTETLLVFDLGGGHLDVAVVRLMPGAVTVLSLSGESWLGGDDLTEVIVGSLIRQLQAERTLRLDETQAERRRLRRQLYALAEQARLALSTVERVRIPLTRQTTGLPVQRVEALTREGFAQLIQPRLAEALDVAERATLAAGLTRDGIDGILLAGGASQTPALEAALSRRFAAARLLRELNPFLAAAQGAALLTGMLESIECPACGHRNPVEAQTCRECHALLVGAECVACPRCFLPNDSRRRACWRCGASLRGVALARRQDFPTRICPHCGRPIPWGRQSCPACHALRRASSAGGLRCRHCGRVLTAGMPSCPDCGELAVPFLGRVAGRSLGIELEDGRLDVVLPRGHSIPSPQLTYRRFALPRAGRRRLDVTVYEGDRPVARDNHPCAELHLELPRGLLAGSAVRIGFAVDGDGLLIARAELADGSGRPLDVAVEPM